MVVRRVSPGDQDSRTNGSGVVVGQVDDRAALWQDGRITRLDLHSKNSVPSAINDAGTVVGTRQE